jgi:hypothetical protein
MTTIGWEFLFLPTGELVTDAFTDSIPEGSYFNFGPNLFDSDGALIIAENGD